MTKTLEEVVAGIQDLALTVTGIKQAPDSIPSSVGANPMVVTYPDSGSYDGNSAGWGTELHVIALDLLLSGADVAQVYKLGLSILGPLFRKLQGDPTLGGNVQTYSTLTYSFDKAAIVWTIKIHGVKLLSTW